MSSSFIKEFHNILNSESYEKYKDVIDIIQQDIKEYDP